MKRWLKIIFFVILFTPVILFGAFWGAVSFIDFNQYKPQLEAEFYANTGHKIDILGDLDLKVVPLRLELGESKIYQKPSFNSEAVLLHFSQVNLNLSLAKLVFEKKFHLLGVELLEPKIYLVIKETGEANWKNLAEKNDAYQFVRVANKPQVENQLTNFLDLELKTLNIENGEIIYENKMNKEMYQLRNLHLMAFNLALDKKFRLQTSAKLEDIKRQETLSLGVNGQGKLSQNFYKFELYKFDGFIEKTLLEHQEEQEGKLSYKLAQAIWQKNENSLTIKELNLQAKGDELELDLEFNSNHFTGAGQLRLARFNPITWLNYIQFSQLNFADKTAFKSLKGSTDFNFSLQGFSLNQLDLQLDESKLEGEISYQREPEKYTFNLSINQLNLDNYKILATNETGETEAYLPLAIPVTTIRNTGIEGKLSVKNLTAWEAKYSNFFTRINSNFGQLRLAPLDAELYLGKLQSSFMVDTNGSTPTYKLKGRLTQVETQDWLSDLLKFEDLAGKLTMQFNFASLGTNLDLIKTNLTGDFNLELQDGAYLAMDLDKVIVGNKVQAGDKTILKQAQLAGQAHQGFLHIQNSFIQSEKLQARVLGKVDLLENSLDTQVFVSYANPPLELMFLRGIELPMKLEGALSKPQWQLDMSKLLGG